MFGKALWKQDVSKHYLGCRKKKAACQILKENNIVYTGCKDQAHQHFSDSFGTKFVNIDDVVNSLNEHIPLVNQDPKLMEPFTSTEIEINVKFGTWER